MRAKLTAGQFRMLWELAGGDAIPLPIQAPSGGRMISDRDRIRAALAQWWADNEDPALLESVRGLRVAGRWLQLEAFAAGKPARALLAMHPQAGAVLAAQDPARAVLDGQDSDWYPDTAVSESGWSLARGSDVHISTGKVGELVRAMLDAVPPFGPGALPALSAHMRGAGGADGALRTRATTTAAERIAALLARPRAQDGTLTLCLPDGAGLRPVARLSWLEVAGDGGYRVSEGGQGELVSVTAARSSELAAAAMALLDSAR